MSKAKWWARHGRVPGEIKEGDVLKRVSTGFIFEVTDPGKLKGYFRVVCFANEREDTQKSSAVRMK